MQLADVAYRLGDMDLSIRLYTKALERLRKYQGDRMAPAYMASGLIESINKARQRPDNSYRTLRYETWQFSKTSFIKGLQCPKYLFLDKHKKAEKTPPSEAKLKLFSQGHSFEDNVRKTMFPTGQNVKEELGFNFAYFNSYTNHLLNNSSVNAIFEGAIIENGVLIMAELRGSLHND